MKYIVIKARAPQDGSPAKTAFLMFPKWMSSTLVCAGIVGRVLELTDGNIIEEGNVAMSEQEVLEGLRVDAAADLDSQIEYGQKTHPIEAEHVSIDTTTAVRHAPDCTEKCAASACPCQPEVAQTPADAAYQREESYRAGMQSARDMFTATLVEHGFVASERGMKEWLVAELTELATRRQETNTFPVSTSADYQRIQELETKITAQLEELEDRAELLDSYKADLKTAHSNLDAWRNAAGANPLIVQNCDPETGSIISLTVLEAADALLEPAPEGVEVFDAEDYVDKLNTLMAEFGALPGQQRLPWLRSQLEELQQARLIIPEQRDALNLRHKHFRTLWDLIVQQGFSIQVTIQGEPLALHSELQAARELNVPMGGPTSVMNFTGSVTINMGCND